MEWKNIPRGIVMGIGDLIPGVSGGTMAVVLGIYDRLILSINQLFTRFALRSLLFIGPLALGMLLAIFSFSQVFNYLNNNHPVPTMFFFLGLIVGVIPFLLRHVGAREHFTFRHYALLLGGAAFLAFVLPNPAEGGDGPVLTSLGMQEYALLFFGGWIASSAMIIPGFSGSLMFMILGIYWTIIEAVASFNFTVIAVVGVGVLIGIGIMSKIIHFFLHHYHFATYALLIGFVIGSIFLMFPGWADDPFSIGISLLTFLAGLIAAGLLGRIEHSS
ncbi:putative membrane protein [Salsuginibacillus halophilus]|uniref:Putative membrane protein n=1 Tax=Salsuginibacillus halophilus TaxID=517424 RepID=A0A2P8HI50_9BACI|nr:DUF368 domain-containing protein [Salsuginibacillus halophilus]PSL45893.1 putative membrane protein [Salsuginibacillus halophilus]